jgi:transglutaminase-like putative cysteine protease
MKRGMKFFKKQVLLSVVSFCTLNITTTAQGFNASFSTVKLNNFQERIYTEERSKYILSSSDTNFLLPNTPFQNVLKRSILGQKCYVTVISGNIAQKKSNISPAYLEDTRFLKLNSKEIIQLSKKFTASRQVVADIAHFVYNHISDKKPGIPIISAKDILRIRSGDCTEHTILTVSILRSLKIPARAAVGMILSREFGDFRNVFVFHMWAEAYIEGRWVLVDSTRPDKHQPNRYITFSYHHLKTEMPLSYLRSISAIKNLTVEYLHE